MDVHVESRIPWCVWGGMEYRIQTRFDWRCFRPTPCCVVSEVLDKGSSTLTIIRDILLSLESPCELGWDIITTGTVGDSLLPVTLLLMVTWYFLVFLGIFWYFLVFSGIFWGIPVWCRTFEPVTSRSSSIWHLGCMTSFRLCDTYLRVQYSSGFDTPDTWFKNIAFMKIFNFCIF